MSDVVIVFVVGVVSGVAAAFPIVYVVVGWSLRR